MIKYSKSMKKEEAYKRGYEVINWFGTKKEAEEVAKAFDKPGKDLLIIGKASSIFYLMSK